MPSPPFEQNIRLMSLGSQVLLLLFPVGLLFVVWLGTREFTFALVMFLPLMLAMLGAVWGGGGRLIVKVEAGRLTVTHVRPGWRKQWSLPVSMERPVFEVRRYGGRSRGLGLLVATEQGKEPVMLVERARFELVEQLQRDLTAWYAAR